MKILIAVYSYSGNTLKVARHLQKEIDADLTEIETVKDKWYLLKIWDSLRGNQVPIKSCINDMSNYDALVVCCPVWAGRTPAAINEYLSMVKHAKDKKFAVLITAGSENTQKATFYIRQYLTTQGMNFIGQIRILAKDVKKKNYQEKIDLFTLKFNVKNSLKKIKN